MVRKIERALGGLQGKTIAVLGLAFKPNTDDMRESPATTIIEGLLAKDTHIRAYDPAAMNEAKRILGDQIEYCQDEYETVDNADVLVIVTEWNQFRRLDLGRIKGLLRQPILVDLRNIYAPFEVETAGFKYYGIGR
jgi:UDPglucose 6-dehydrogenase